MTAYSPLQWGNVGFYGFIWSFWERYVFRGVSSINLDSKGRLAIPVKYRDALQTQCQGNLVATIDTDEQCLLLYPLDVWGPIEEKIEALSSFNPATRRIQRLLIGHATDLELDTNGRILIPTLLREYANLSKHTVLLGQGRKFELWDEAHWQQQRTEYLATVNQTGPIPDELQALSL